LWNGSHAPLAIKGKVARTASALREVVGGDRESKLCGKLWASGSATSRNDRFQRSLARHHSAAKHYTSSHHATHTSYWGECRAM